MVVYLWLVNSFGGGGPRHSKDGLRLRQLQKAFVQQLNRGHFRCGHQTVRVCCLEGCGAALQCLQVLVRTEFYITWLLRQLNLGLLFAALLPVAVGNLRIYSVGVSEQRLAFRGSQLLQFNLDVSFGLRLQLVGQHFPRRCEYGFAIIQLLSHERLTCLNFGENNFFTTQVEVGDDELVGVCVEFAFLSKHCQLRLFY